MKLIFLFLAFTSYCVKGQEVEKRHIYFYSFDCTSTKTEITSKLLGRISDSALISDITLITENKNGNIDTIKCKYTNNTIFFYKFDSSKKDFIKMYLSFKLNYSISKIMHDEKLTIPYKEIFEQTTEYSNISISLERKSNNFYRISISKLDYPFATTTQFLSSEILNLFKKK